MGYLHLPGLSWGQVWLFVHTTDPAIASAEPVGLHILILLTLPLRFLVSAFPSFSGSATMHLLIPAQLALGWLWERGGLEQPLAKRSPQTSSWHLKGEPVHSVEGVGSDPSIPSLAV